MPLDPSLVFGSSPDVKPFDMLGTIVRAETFNDQQAARKAKQAEAERQARAEQILQQYADDPDTGIEVLRGIDYKSADEAQKSLTASRRALADKRKVELDNEAAELTMLSKFLPDNTETSWNNAKARFGTDPEAGVIFNQPYSPELSEQLRLYAVSAADRLAAEKHAIESKEPSAWAPWFATADDQDEWDKARSAARVLLGKNADTFLSVLPEQWSPEAVVKAKALAMGPAKTADVADAVEGREIQREGQSITMRGQDMQAETAAANRAVTVRGQDLVNARAKEAAASGGSGAGGAKLGVGAVEKIAGVDQSLAMLDDIDRLFPKMTGNVGVLDGLKAQAKLRTGIGIDEDLATFAAQITGLKNATIKALTGAAMSEPEAKRIMQQIPDLTNPESVFKARLATTRKNLELLKKRTIELSGGSVEPAGGGGNDPMGIR